MRGLLVLAVIATAAWTWPLVDLSADRSAREYGEAILATVAPGAVVIGYWDTVPVVQYLQLVEGQRPDVLAINRFLIGTDELRMLIEREAPRRPVYIDVVPADLPVALQAVPAGELFHLRPTPKP
jgi:hypothetical protein